MRLCITGNPTRSSSQDNRSPLKDKFTLSHELDERDGKTKTKEGLGACESCHTLPGVCYTPTHTHPRTRTRTHTHTHTYIHAHTHVGGCLLALPHTTAPWCGEFRTRVVTVSQHRMFACATRYVLCHCHATRMSGLKHAGLFSGVFVPCVLSIFSVILFLRLGFIIGHATL